MVAHTTLRGDHAPTGPNVYEIRDLSPRLRVSYLTTSPSPGVIQVSIDVPQYVDTDPRLRRFM